MKTLLGGFKLILSTNQIKEESVPKPKPKTESCENQPLIKNNYLSEFSSSQDRQKVLKNLGIDFKTKWGEIGGYLEKQKDVVEFIEKNNKASFDELNTTTIKKELDGDSATTQIKYSNKNHTDLHSLKESLDYLFENEQSTISVQNKSDLSSIPSFKLQEGSLVYVSSEDTYYKYLNNTWEELQLSGIIEINTVSELKNLKPGTLVYVKDIHEFKYYQNDKTVIGLNNIVVSTTEPDKNVLWVDPTDNYELNQSGEINSIKKSLSILQQQMNKVMQLVTYGCLAGDSSVGGRTIMMASANPINPNPEADEEVIEQSEPEHLTYTIPNFSIKVDTLENFKKNSRNLVSGELIWISDQNSLYIYINGGFKPISNGSSTPIPDDMTQEDIESFYFNHLGFTNSKSEQYKLEINDNGNIVVYNTKNYDGNIGDKGKYGSYISDYLRINSIFLGGINTKLDSFSACTHNYVELANASSNDINLNGIYLLYRAPEETNWRPLALKGIIKAGSTFLIRGDRCSYKSNISLDVNSYDQLWYDNGNLIQFDQGGGVFYLVCSNEGKFYRDKNLVSLEDLSGYNPYSAIADDTPIGYIDLVGIKTKLTTATIPAEGNKPITSGALDDPKDLIWVRSFTLDPCSQAQKTQDKKANSALWTYINMSTKSKEAFPYYSESDKQKFVPKGSILNKNIFDTRSTFDTTKPNMLNITFGIQATDNGSGATRCFNWVSVGYYDEYIEYKKDSEDWSGARKVESIVKGRTYTDANIKKYIDIYTRIKWVTTNGTAVTTHKCIVRGLTAGSYNVRVRRYNDENYIGDTLTFVVRSNSQVGTFRFIQTTDQQSFNFYEYQAWRKAAWAISQTNGDSHFMINTGDMTQNGNRENEWIDYYNGRKPLINLEEMVTIGNNDLCGITPYELGNGNADLYKINHKNIQYYYCFELDTNNSPIFTFRHTSKINTSILGDVLSYTETTFDYYMPSLYSFNYGNYHFICLNSEFAPNTYRCYYDDPAISDLFKQHAFYNMYKWLVRDYNANSSKKLIAYMHELPFCIVVGDKTTGLATNRTISNGSKLNNDFSDGISCTPDSSDSKASFVGGCNFSQFFQEHNIKLCLGGHKHTYSLSYPVKERVTTSGTRTVDYANPIIDTTGHDGVVYAMCQATGYKLVSNKELPGNGIAWLRKYFPMHVGGTASSSQYYPMYSTYNCRDTSIDMQSYVVYNIYSENGTKATPFNINSQYVEFTTKNAIPIEGTNITIQ